MKKLVVIGCGYVGLVTGASFAERGHSVICFDIDGQKIQALKTGVVPIYEPGLAPLVRKNLALKTLSFTDDLATAAQESDIFILAVPTPSLPSGSCDLSYVLAAVKALAAHLEGRAFVITKSTVPVGTSEKIRETILANVKKEIDLEVVSNPEFLKEGAAIGDCLRPERVIFGVESQAAEEVLRELYAPFGLRDEQIVVMDPPSAEMTKYAANAMLATRISFMNELASLCEKLGANIHAVREGIGADPRIGPKFLNAGVGFGGSCFPKDVRALKGMGREAGCEMTLLSATDLVNDRQKLVLFKKMEAYFEGDWKGKVVAIWGLSFKPDTDDLREAPALVLIEALAQLGVSLRLYDPVAQEKARKVLSYLGITFCSSEYEAADGADAIALVTEWQQFKSVRLEDIIEKMRGRGFFDGRNLYEKKMMENFGFDYFGIGVPGRASKSMVQATLT